MFFNEHPEWALVFDWVLTAENYLPPSDKDIRRFCKGVLQKNIESYIHAFRKAKNVSWLGYRLLIDDSPLARDQAKECPTGAYEVYSVHGLGWDTQIETHPNRNLAKTVLAQLGLPPAAAPKPGSGHGPATADFDALSQLWRFLSLLCGIYGLVFDSSSLLTGVPSPARHRATCSFIYPGRAFL